MHVLFAISVLALVALLWASAAIVRHVRRSRSRRRRLLANSAESSTHVPLERSQDANPPSIDFSKVSPFRSSAFDFPEPTASPAPPAPVSASLADLAARLASDPPAEALRNSSPRHQLASLLAPLPPQSARPDWAYFNKDMGDLSDPQSPRRKRGVKSVVKAIQNKAIQNKSNQDRQKSA
jgi:hypothetical protein